MAVRLDGKEHSSFAWRAPSCACARAENSLAGCVVVRNHVEMTTCQVVCRYPVGAKDVKCRGIRPSARSAIAIQLVCGAGPEDIHSGCRRLP